MCNRTSAGREQQPRASRRNVVPSGKLLSGAKHDHRGQWYNPAGQLNTHARRSHMADPRDTRFIVAPLTTALQRLTRNGVKAFVLVWMADDELVDFGELSKTLAAWP